MDIFISHRHEDYPKAQAFAEALHKHSTEVNAFLSERIPGGDYWQEKIEEALRNADFFLLVYTGGRAGWDWCIFEAGLYEGLSKQVDKSRRLICIHDPGVSPPRPLMKFQHKVIDFDGMNQVLRIVLEPTQAEILNDKRGFVREVENLVASLQGRADELYYTDSFRINIPDIPADINRALPVSSIVSGNPAVFRMLFGANFSDCTWADFVKHAYESEDFRWINELSETLASIRSSKEPRMLRARVISADGALKFRLIPHRIETLPDHSIQCEVLMIREAASRREGLGEKAVSLIGLTRVCLRFQAEILEYAGSIEDSALEIGVKNFRERFRREYLDIEHEASLNSFFDTSALVESFSGKHNRSEAKLLINDYKKIRKKIFTGLGMSIDPQVWTIFEDRKFSAEELATFQDGLDELHKMINALLKLVLDEQGQFVDIPEDHGADR